jgi:hypothetical protein
MASASITRLRIRKLRFLPGFLFHTLRCQRQLRRSPGFLGGYTATGPRRTFWTVTLWRDEAAMHAFRRTGAHLKAMPKLLDWCDEASVATLGDAGNTLPTPGEAARRLEAEGRLSKVRNPSAEHVAGRLWPDQTVPRAGPAMGPLQTSAE